MTANTFDDRQCLLGEGPLWHPVRQQLFWFDILNKKLLTRDNGSQQEWMFDETVSAAGWIDTDTLLIASATGLWCLSLTTGSRKLIAPLEADNKITRSNDGRADPWGGFWIGTMGYNAETGSGSIYRFYQGQLRKLFAEITISNSICFAPNRSAAYFTDTATRKIMKTALDRSGWPAGAPQVFLDLSAEALNPDGAVVDAQGSLWVAQWGAGRVAAYDTSGSLQHAIELPATQVTCPAFGGEDLKTLYVTSATEGLDPRAIASNRSHGQVFSVEGIAQGLPEPKVLL